MELVRTSHNIRETPPPSTLVFMDVARLLCFFSQQQPQMKRARLEGAAAERGATPAPLEVVLTTGTWSKQGLKREQLG